MMTPPAPAVWALIALVLNGQPPRWMSAMLPAVKPPKSAAAQPGPSEPAVAVTCCTGAVTSPLPEYVIVAKSSGEEYVSPPVTANVGSASSSK